MNLLVESWTDYERGWGQSRGGYVVYLNQENRAAYLEAFYSDRPKSKSAPDFYTQEDGNPTIRDIQDPEVVAQTQRDGYYVSFERNPSWLK